nr:DUF1828 domain-containing protein [Caballeronia sp. AZ7_KS35]
MTIDCSWLRQTFSYDCRPVKTVNGDAALEIGTPFSFSDGSAIVFYVVEHGAHSVLSDNGDTLYHLSTVGLDPFNWRRASLIRNTIAPYGMSLEANGEIRALAGAGEAQHKIASYIAGLLAIAAQELAWRGVPETVNNFADDVEQYLRAWRPAATIVRHPKVKGISAHDYTFAFLWGDELVDVVTPSHQATGSLMRKLGDVLSAPGEPPKIRVVIDDRHDFERAETEKQIIGSMASAMLFTSLVQAAGRPTVH